MQGFFLFSIGFSYGIQIVQKLIKINTIPMVNHRIKLNDCPLPNHSFSHQQSISHQQSKHKKKGSLYIRNDRTPNYHRLKTDQKDSYGPRQEHVQSFGTSVHLGHSNNSVTKLSRGKQKTSVGADRKNKKSKNTISVINLSKSNDEVKGKGSSTMTKRKQSSVDFTDKIKQKIQDFKIISSCLEEYTKEQRKHNSDVNLTQIIKIISAFNRSQIAPISKPLQKLISQIVASIQFSLPVKAPRHIKSVSFDSPDKASRHIKSVSFDSPDKASSSNEQIKDTVKKPNPKGYIVRQQESDGQVGKLQQNLGRLKYESNRLKYFLDEIASHNGSRRIHEDSSQIQKQKLFQLQQLQDIAEQQTKIIHELDNEQNTFRDDR